MLTGVGIFLNSPENINEYRPSTFHCLFGTQIQAYRRLTSYKAEAQRNTDLLCDLFQCFDFSGIPRDPGININPVPGSRDRQNGPGLNALVVTRHGYQQLRELLVYYIPLVQLVQLIN